MEEKMDKQFAKTIWLQERCQRCHGNLHLERELFGQPVAKCLMCSRTFILTEIRPPVIERSARVECS